MQSAIPTLLASSVVLECNCVCLCIELLLYGIYELQCCLTRWPNIAIILQEYLKTKKISVLLGVWPSP